MNRRQLYTIRYLILFFLSFTVLYSFAQKDSAKRFVPADSLAVKSLSVARLKKIDSVLKFHTPKKATIRSALIPGWGQAYNKKYWKIPIIYGALGFSAGIFFYNLGTYKDLKFAYKAKTEAVPRGYPYARPDSTDYFKIKSIYVQLDVNALRSFRDEFRKNIDYSVLAFILLWGLNVADAAVDAHLKTFDVSPDLSFHIRIGHSQLAGTNGISLVMKLK